MGNVGRLQSCPTFPSFDGPDGVARHLVGPPRKLVWTLAGEGKVGKPELRRAFGSAYKTLREQSFSRENVRKHTFMTRTMLLSPR